MAVVRLPRVSNVTDVDALAAEPGVDVLVTTDPGVVADADLAVLPGHAATVSDLAWLRGRGLAEAIVDRARRGAPVLGICGGYQMLAAHDRGRAWSRHRAGRPGWGCCRCGSPSQADKVLGRPAGSWRGHPVHGVRDPPRGGVEVDGDAEPFLDGWRVGAVWGTMWHGAFENDGFRRAWLTEVAAAAGSPLAPGRRSARVTPTAGRP